MDNDPDEASPFSILESLDAIYRLLTLLSTQKLSPVMGLKLLEMPTRQALFSALEAPFESVPNQYTLLCLLLPSLAMVMPLLIVTRCS